MIIQIIQILKDLDKSRTWYWNKSTNKIYFNIEKRWVSNIEDKDKIKIKKTKNKIKGSKT